MPTEFTTVVSSVAVSIATVLATSKKLYLAAAILPFGILLLPIVLLARIYLAKREDGEAETAY